MSDHRIPISFDADGRVVGVGRVEAAPVQSSSAGSAEVRFGFASYKGGKFELIAINTKTGDEIILEGQLRPDQTIEQIDKVLPTCVYVTGAPAQAMSEPVCTFPDCNCNRARVMGSGNCPAGLPDAPVQRSSAATEHDDSDANLATPCPICVAEGFLGNDCDHTALERSRASTGSENRARCLQKLQAEYNDLLALQDQTDSIPLSKAMDIAELGLSFIGAGSEPQTVPQPSTSFDEWFLKVSSWGLSHEELVRASLTAPGNDPGDAVYTSPTGSVMTRHICSHWINFYGAAQFGWNSALALSRPQSRTGEA